MAANMRARYARAVHSGNLLVRSAKHTADEAETVLGDPEVLGAYGLADRNLTRGHDGRGHHSTPAPLAVPLARLFAGDTKAAHELVRILSDMALNYAWNQGIELYLTESRDIARAVLAWHRNGTCQPCGGRGKPIIPDSPVQSAHDCPKCDGTGKIPFESSFRYEWKPVARWLKDEIERTSGRAGQEAMRMIAGRMDLK